MIDTARLILRMPEPGDWPAYRDYRLSPRSTLPDASLGTAWTQFSSFFGHWTLRGYGRFIATLRSDGRAVGHFGPYRPEGHPEPELTWTLWDAGLEGQGIAAEAAWAMHGHMFGALGCDRVVSYIDAGNARSRALAARLGARHDSAAVSPYGTGVEVWRHRRSAA
jgi:RimJ/RimL family protein N-acetyltransferase